MAQNGSSLPLKTDTVHIKLWCSRIYTQLTQMVEVIELRPLQSNEVLRKI